MIFKNSLNFINNFFLFFKKKFSSLYLNSNIYNKKISSSSISSLEYRPSPSLLDCLIKYEKKRTDIKNYSLDQIWNNKNLKEKDYNNLNSFFWLFSLDLRSSKKDTQNIISKWIEKNHPNSGLFRVYWKDIEGPYDGGVTFDLTEGKKGLNAVNVKVV